MGQIRTAKAGDLAAFPSSTFVINDTPPIAQCQETKIVDSNPSWTQTESTITILISLAAIDVVGKQLDIFDSPFDDGNYTVLAQNGQVLTIDHVFAGGAGISDAEIHDQAGPYLTRNESSFQRFIENEGQAHTTKGGQLFTDTPTPPMNAACSDTFDPQ